MPEFPRSSEHILEHKNNCVRYFDWGKGTAVVLLHGFMEDATIWSDYASQLKRTHRVICIDLPGHGSTGNFGYVHTMEEMAEVVLAVLRKLKLRRVHLVGHSMGGYVSLAFADKHPDHVRSLTLFHSTAAADSKEKQSNRARAIKVIKKDLHRFVKEAVPGLFHTTPKRPQKRLIARSRKMALATSVQGVVAAQEGMRIRDDRTIIMKFAPYPVHYLLGEFDGVLPLELMMKEVTIAKSPHVTIVEDCGHMGFWEKEKECLQALLLFLKSVKS